MAITSMTGFARADGAHGGLAWHWEAKSVNGRALDVRCRLPQGLESLEIGIRAWAAKHFRRGNLLVTLQLSRGAAPAEVRLNEPVVEAMIALAEDLRRRLDSPPVRAEHLLALRGVVVLSIRSSSVLCAFVRSSRVDSSTVASTASGLSASRVVAACASSPSIRLFAAAT